MAFQKDTRFSLGVFYMLLSAAGISFTVFFSKLGLQDLSLASLIFFRFASSLLFCGVFLAISGKFFGIFPIKNLWIHLARAFFVLLAQYSIFYYLENNTLLNATVLLNTGPLFIPIIERVILKQKVGKSTWIGVAVSFVGMLLILQPHKEIFAIDGLIGMLAGFSQGASQVLFGHSAKKEKTEVSVLYLFTLCTLASAIPYFFLNVPKIAVHASLWPIVLIIILLGIASTSNQLFRGAAYLHGKPSNLATFLYISVLLSGIIDWLVFHNIPNTFSIVGAALVIFGGILKVVLRRFFIRRQQK